jgi:hypothetical protein
MISLLFFPDKGKLNLQYTLQPIHYSETSKLFTNIEIHTMNNQKYGFLSPTHGKRAKLI